MKRLDRFDWAAIETELDREGQAVLSRLLSGAQCDALAAAEPLANLTFLGALRAQLYERLVPIANRWNRIMASKTQYPARLDQLLRKCAAQGQRTPQSAVIRLRAGEQQPLGQNAAGRLVFPLQVAVLLTDPGQDFTGGELVMTEQRPRMQTRPMVVPLRRGDAGVFAVHHRPFEGAKGFYRVNLRHAVSKVRSGERIALELVFHDAP